jgi:hypothetical protein
MPKVIKVFISLVFGALVAMLGVPMVAMVKAVLPIFRLTEGTSFQIYLQDPILYIFGPLSLGYVAFRAAMRKNMTSVVLNSTALGVVAGLAAAVITAWAIPFREFEGPVRWLLILAQFPIIPLVLGYTVFRVAARRGRTLG